MAQLTKDLSHVSDWGKENLVVFNASKTQFLHLTTRSDLASDFVYDVFFEGIRLEPSISLNILGVSFSRDLYWKNHIVSLANQASKRLGVLRRLKRFFTPSQLFALYRGLVRPCMEYASHVWGRSPRDHVACLDLIQSRAVRLIDSQELTSIQPLRVRRNVASLSLFYSILQWSLFL